MGGDLVGPIMDIFMDDFLSYFSNDYSSARTRFMSAVHAAGLTVTSYQNPVTGPQGETLATDVVCLGPTDASRRLLVCSATHGAEGFCGSGVQVGLLAKFGQLELPEDTNLILVHALNPYGFAWLRRVTEDNIDLNRNFVDHASGIYPANPGYDELASALVPEKWDEVHRIETQAVLDRYGDVHGLFALQAAISLGQYDHSDGLFYGGRAPAWSRRTFEKIVASQIAGADHAAFVDFHTGLGPYGYGEPICFHVPGSDGFARAAAWYGDDVTSPYDGEADSANSTSAAVVGHLGYGCEWAAPETEWTALALEFGTQPVADVIDALRADAWLHAHGDLNSELGREIKATMRAAFYGDEPDWKRKVWLRGSDIVARALAGLAAL